MQAIHYYIYIWKDLQHQHHLWYFSRKVCGSSQGREGAGEGGAGAGAEAGEERGEAPGLVAGDHGEELPGAVQEEQGAQDKADEDTEGPG